MAEMSALRSYGVAIGMMLAVVPARGAIITYSNTLTTANNYNTNYNTIRTMWEATLASQVTVNFETATVADTAGVLVHSGSGYSVQSACPVLAPNESCIADWNWSPPPGTSHSRVRSSVSPMPTGLRYFHGAAGNSNGIEIRLPSGTLSFAADLWTTSLAGRPVYVEIWSPTNTYMGAYSIPTNNNTTAAFIGFVSATVVGRILMSVGSSGSIMVDRYDFNGVAGGGEIPESASLSYVAIGIAAILVGSSKKLLRRRDRGRSLPQPHGNRIGRFAVRG